MTPRAWCLPNTLIYNSKGLTERQEREERERNKLERGKQLLSLCLVKGRAGYRRTPTHTLDRLLTVSSLSGFVDGILGASQAYGGLQRLIQ